MIINFQYGRTTKKKVFLEFSNFVHDNYQKIILCYSLLKIYGGKIIFVLINLLIDHNYIYMFI